MFSTGLPDLAITLAGIPVPADTNVSNDLDIVYAGSGNDSILSGDDRDLVYGGDDDDIIDGGYDRDTIFGDIGNDTIIGNEGSDHIEGGDGNDVLYGFADQAALNEEIPGLAGVSVNAFIQDDLVDSAPDNDRDTIFGGVGNDTIWGQDDDDSLSGGDGSDEIYGGIDEDTLEGLTGDDMLYGGAGADSIDGSSAEIQFTAASVMTRLKVLAAETLFMVVRARIRFIALRWI